MKNFFGRLIILIDSIINCALIIVIIGCFLFFAIDDFESLKNFFVANTVPISYLGASLVLADFIIFLVITIICMIDIINGKSMKHAFYGSIVLFIVNLVSLFTNLYIPHIDTVYFGLFIGLSITLIITTSFQIVGCGFNYYKDCR